MIWIDLKLNFKISGRLSFPKSHTLENVRDYRINQIGKYNSIYVLQEEKFTYPTNISHMLPIVIEGRPCQKRIMVTPSKILYFPRIAKTGSRTFIEILRSLGKSLGYVVDVPYYKAEVMGADEYEIKKEIKEILICHRDSAVRTRHFNFIDFEKYGVRWNPDWFSIVRDPVDRVCAVFLIFKICTF